MAAPLLRILVNPASREAEEVSLQDQEWRLIGSLQFNDFNQIHRMAWEEQPEITQGIVVQYNSIHDFYNPYFGTFGQSFACCDGSGSGNGLRAHLT